MKKSLLLFSMCVLMVFPLAARDLSGYRIGIDAGHGGSDPGAQGPRAPHEATLCLNMCNSLRTKLQSDNAPTMMTRTSNVYVSLSARASKFTSYDPYIALSVHLNAANTTAYGTETWYCKTTGNSYSLASSMHTRMVACMRDGALGCATAPTKGGRTFARGVKQTCWTVINISSNIPGTLTEGLFIDNPSEHTYLCSTGGFNAWVMGHLYGCYTHINKCVNSSVPATPPAAGVTLTLSTSTTSIAFGNVVVGQKLDRGVSVTINGASSASISTNNPTNFKISQGTVNNGQSFAIGFYPSAQQNYSGTVTVTASAGGQTKSVAISCTGTGVPQPRTITPAANSVEGFSAVIMQEQIKTLNVSGSNLTSNIAVSCSNPSIFEVTPTSLGTSGGTLSIKFKPTEVRTYTGKITLSSSGANTVTVSLSGKGRGIPINLQQVWNYSQKNGLPAASDTKKGWASDPLKIRNFDYANGALYVVNAADGIITKVNAQTGETLGELNMTGVNGGALKVCDCKVISGKVIASNVTGNPAEDPFKVYVWDQENMPPRVLLQTNNAGTDIGRIGDCIGLKGDLTNGVLLFGGKTSLGKNRVVKFTITNGVCNTTPTIINMVDLENKEMYFGNSVRVQSASSTNEKFWCNGQNYLPTLFEPDGTMSATVNPEAMDIGEGVMLNGNTAGNAFKAFTFGGVQYGVATRYNIVTSVTDGSTYKGGRFNLFDATEGWAKASKLGEYPAAGLGTDYRNTNCASSLAVAVTRENNVDTGLEVWVSVLGQGIACFKSGTVKQQNPTPVTPSTDPTISFGTPGLSFSTVATEPKSQGVTITAANLTANITFELTGTNANLFSVSPQTVDKTGGQVTITYSPTAEGTHTATLKALSSGASATLNLTGQASKKTYFNENVTDMEEVWNYSTNKNNTAQAPWLILSDVVSRDMALLNNKLYVLNAKAWNTTPEIVIVNAKTGAKIGNLNVTGIAGGESVLGSVKALGGKIIASNGARTPNDALKVYKWDSDAAAPAVWLEDATHANTHGGEIMSVSGDMTNGRVIFSDGTKVFYYTVTNGTIATSPTVINLTKDGTAYSVGAQKGSVDVTFNSDGSLWVTGKDRQPTLFNSSGVYQGELSTAAVGGPVHGTSARFFTFGTKKYAAVVTYLNKTASSLAEGCFSIVDITGGFSAPEQPNGIYPSAGLGNTRNTLFNSAVCQSVEDKVLNVWVLVPFQGCAYFKYNGETTSPPVAIDQVRNDAAKMVLYNHTETLFVDGIEAANIDLYTLTGQKIRTVKNSNELSVAGLQGIYLVIVKDSNNMMHTGKVILK